VRLTADVPATVIIQYSGADRTSLAGLNHGHIRHRRLRPSLFKLVHGEEETMGPFAALLSNTRIDMPGLHQSFEL
jgi:hypothetical protein